MIRPIANLTPEAIDDLLKEAVELGEQRPRVRTREGLRMETVVE